jgi:alkylhydroperoxidase family enzyme
MSDAKLLDVPRFRESEHFAERERVALTYADAMTVTSEEVSDELFASLRSLYSPEEIIELTATVAFENFLSKFHRALRVDAQGFCPISVMGQESASESA